MPIFSKTRIIKQGLLLGGCLALGNVWAGGPEIAMAPPWLPLDAGISLYGMGGNGWTAIGDALIPMFGQANGFVFLDPQAYYHSDQNHEGNYSADIGAGYRRLVDNNVGILGAYVFGDFNRGDTDKEFWFVSPGIERLGQILDFSANAYIPVSSQRQNTGTEFADQAGDNSQITFEGHNQFDALVNTFSSVGYGGDIQVGVHIPYFRNSEVFVGGYYFSPKDNDNVGGGAVRLQVPVNRYLSVLVSEAYDSEYHNTLKAGLTLWFGGRHTGYDFTGNLAERLVDPIQRNLVAVAGGSFTAQPILSGFENTGETELELSNISFFVPDAPIEGAQPVQGDGTFENPYIGISQSNVDNANLQNNRNFYLDSGTYNPIYASMNDYIILNNDQIFGRQDNFRENAEGAARPLLNFTAGGFEVPAGDVNDSISGLRLTGGINTTDQAGIWINHENGLFDQKVSINNSSVDSFADGIDILNGGGQALTVNINDSWISHNDGIGELFASYGVTGGIAAVNDLTTSGAGPLSLKINCSTIKNNSKTPSTETLLAAGGVAALNLGSSMKIDVQDSLISNNSVFADNSDNDLSNSLNNIDALGGLAAVNASEDNMTIDIDGSSLVDNTVSVNNTLVNTAGGLAVFDKSKNGNIYLDVSQSSLSGNSIFGDNAAIVAAGGLAVGSESDFGNVIVDVSYSNLFHNSVSADDTSIIGTAGGLAAFNHSHAGEMTIGITQSNLSGNSVSATNGGTISTAGGVAAETTFSSMSVDIRQSIISDNSVFTDDTGSINLAGGVAAESLSPGLLNIDIKKSALIYNDVSGIAADGSTDVSVDRSIIAWNSGFGLSATNGATIDVTKPIFFDGVVNVQGGGAVHFPGIFGPVPNNAHVVCPPFSGKCKIVMP